MGDPELVAAVRAAIGDERGLKGIVVAMVEGGEVRTAGLGESGNPEHPLVTGSTPFEIGSVTKTLTGMLLADLAAKGRVRLDEPVSDLLPQTRFSDPAVGSATLAELASHRAGLPNLPVDFGFTGDLTGNPYEGIDPEEVVAAAARSETAGIRGTYAYSNFGMSLLGHALAARAGMPYPELLDRRILAPLGMHETMVVIPGVQPPPHGAYGYTPDGQPVAFWHGWGYAPAGVGAWSTSDDLARLVIAVMRSSAPGSDAAQPRFEADEDLRIGLGWHIVRIDNREITWHNGGTGGFASFVGFDRSVMRGVVVLANTSTSVDAVGVRLLGIDVPTVDSGE